MTTRKTSVSHSVLLLACGVALSGAAMAQEAEAPDDSRYELKPVVVTAQKTEENLQSVPISVDVLPGEEIERLGMTNLDEFAKNLPNFDVQKSGSATLISIRGVGSGNNRGFEQSVGMFVDGVYAGREQQFAVPFFDVERVEVLKGTQSILFGKNTIAGAVNIITARPTESFQASVTGYYEDTKNERRISGYVSGPVTDTLRLRGAFRIASEDGYLHNTLVDEDNMTIHDGLYRVSAEWDATPDITVGAKYETALTKQKGSPFQLTSFGNYESLFRMFDADIDADLNDTNSSGRFNDNNTKIESENAAINVRANLGDFVLSSVTGYSAFKSETTDDSDFSPIPLIAYSDLQDFELYSQELRLESPKGGIFEYVVGAYYQDASYYTTPRFDIDGSVIGTVQTSAQRVFDQDASVWSVFGEGTWSLRPDLRLVGGVRYTEEEKDAIKTHTIVEYLTDTPETDAYTLIVNRVALGAVNYAADLSRSESNTSPALSVEWDVLEDSLVYAKWTKGFKSGGFDVADRNGASLEYEGEEATSYELGAKSRFAGGRAELNAAIFRSDFDDLQVSAFNGITMVTSNAAKARTQGVELNGRWQVSRDLMLTGAGAFTDATYQDYSTAACTPQQTAVYTGTGTCLQDLGGRPLFLSSKWTLNMNLRHTADLPGEMTLQSDLGLNYRSKFYTAQDLRASSLQDGYSTLDAGVTLFGRDDGWSLSAQVRNLTDETAIGYLVGLPIFTGAEGAYLLPPRTVALSGTINF